MNSEFQSFKHVEILGPGEHMRAQQPLEATLAINPTVVLTNALPYPMHLILWQVGVPPNLPTLTYHASCWHICLPNIKATSNAVSRWTCSNVILDMSSVMGRPDCSPSWFCRWHHCTGSSRSGSSASSGRPPAQRMAR